MPILRGRVTIFYSGPEWYAVMSSAQLHLHHKHWCKCSAAEHHHDV